VAQTLKGLLIFHHTFFWFTSIGQVFEPICICWFVWLWKCYQKLHSMHYFYYLLCILLFFSRAL
jgi:hypothetical protein